MAERDSVLEKVKRFVSLTGDGLPVLSGLNLPWLLAKTDAVYREMLPLFKARIFLLENPERKQYYSMLADMADDMISALETVYAETSRSSGEKQPEDPELPVFRVIYRTLKLLEAAADMSLLLGTEDKAVEEFAGGKALAQIRLLDDSAADMEVNILHGISEYLDAVAPSIQRVMEQRRLILSKTDYERYEKALVSIGAHYHGIPPARAPKSEEK